MAIPLAELQMKKESLPIGRLALVLHYLQCSIVILTIVSIATQLIRSFLGKQELPSTGLALGAALYGCGLLAMHLRYDLPPISAHAII